MWIYRFHLVEGVIYIPKVIYLHIHRNNIYANNLHIFFLFNQIVIFVFVYKLYSLCHLIEMNWYHLILGQQRTFQTKIYCSRKDIKYAQYDFVVRCHLYIVGHNKILMFMISFAYFMEYKKAILFVRKGIYTNRQFSKLFYWPIY